MTFLPPAGDGSATRTAVPSQSPGSPEPGLTATAAPDAARIAYPYSWEPGPRSTRLGVVALIVALVLLVLSLVTSVATGMLIGPYLPTDGSTDGVAIADSIEADGAGALILTAIAHVAIGAALGLWALVQGIVAVAGRRGRGAGIAAIIIAVTAPIVSYVVFTITAGVAAAVSTGGVTGA